MFIFSGLVPNTNIKDKGILFVIYILLNLKNN